MSYTHGWPVKSPAPTARSAKAAYARISLARRQELLSRVPMFETLKKRQLASIARTTETAGFGAGEVIVTVGDQGDFCGIIVDGTAEVTKRGKAIARLGPGDLFGELAVLDPAPRSATVQALTEVTAIRIRRDPLADVIAADAGVAMRILEALARRIRETTELIG
jgi:CRP/FNR family cyclic AMP-dependent transcriptional regulator